MENVNNTPAMNDAPNKITTENEEGNREDEKRHTFKNIDVNQTL